jgi:hypothetical protein
MVGWLQSINKVCDTPVAACRRWTSAWFRAAQQQQAATWQLVGGSTGAIQAGLQVLLVV